jgi:hypothetical protein
MPTAPVERADVPLDVTESPASLGVAWHSERVESGDLRIPERYQKLWIAALAVSDLVHHTTSANLAAIEQAGFIEPRDPSPKHWAGLVAVFMADATDPLYLLALTEVLAHVREKDEKLVRLRIRTANTLDRSTDPKRTFQVISLDPIPLREGAEVEVI